MDRYFTKKRTGIICNYGKHDNRRIVSELEKITEDMGVECLMFSDGTFDAELPLDAIHDSDIDFLISVGGDGTVISAAGFAAECDLPLLSVNNGRVGFLTEIEKNDYKDAITRIYKGDFRIAERMMLECTAGNRKYTSLNDFTVYKKSFAGVVQLSVNIDGIDAGQLFCDGAIVSTPTGATAYSLSAGGPVIAPGLDVIVVTPVCPHTLCYRPIVAGKDSKISIKAHNDCLLAVAGDPAVDICANEEVTMQKSALVCKMIIMGEQNIYSLIREKLT